MLDRGQAFRALRPRLPRLPLEAQGRPDRPQTQDACVCGEVWQAQGFGRSWRRPQDAKADWCGQRRKWLAVGGHPLAHGILGPVAILVPPRVTAAKGGGYG